MVLDFKVIAIGSSAGGLMPLIEIISVLPCPFPALILIPHLLKDKHSYLADIVARATAIPVI